MDTHSSSHDTPGKPADVEKDSAKAKVSNDVIRSIFKDCKNGQPKKDWGKDKFKNIHPAHRRIIGKKKHDKRAKEYKRLKDSAAELIPRAEEEDQDEFSRAFFEKCRIIREQRQQDEALDAYFREEYADCVIYEVPSLEFQDYEAFPQAGCCPDEEAQFDFGCDFNVEEVSNPDEFQVGELVQLALATEHEEALAKSCAKNKMRLVDVEATGSHRSQGPILDYSAATTIRGDPEKNWTSAKSFLMKNDLPIVSWQSLETQCAELQDEVETERYEFQFSDVAPEALAESSDNAFDALMSTKVLIPKLKRNNRIKTVREPLPNFKGTIIFTQRTAELDEAIRRMPLMIHSSSVPKSLLKSRGLRYYAKLGLVVFTDDLSLCDQDTIYVVPSVTRYCAEGLLNGRSIPDSVKEYRIIRSTFAVKFKMKAKQSLMGFLQSRMRIRKTAG